MRKGPTRVPHKRKGPTRAGSQKLIGQSKADRTKFSGSMVLIAEAQQVKAKLQLKGRWRPDKMVRKKMPDGTGLLANVPQRRTSSRAVDDSVQDATLDQEYCDAIDKVSAVFGRQKRSNSTADEHRMYIRMLDGWLVRKGFGSYVEAIFDKHGLLVEVRPRRTATGEVKVLKAQMLIGYLLEMASGSKDTPKGGHAGDLLAQAGQEAVSACGVRSKMKRKKGTYGTGACADEPWSLQAYQKRVYAVRHQLREEHPMVRGARPGERAHLTGNMCCCVCAVCTCVRRYATATPSG
jgi:hypothetical protein